jgi:hypothetical protein
MDDELFKKLKGSGPGIIEILSDVYLQEVRKNAKIFKASARILIMAVKSTAFYFSDLAKIGAIRMRTGRKPA